MGRSLFSQSFHSSPVVRTEPEQSPDVCEIWGHWNRFDPDSDEFWNNAQYEAPIDPAMDTAIYGRGQLRMSLEEEILNSPVSSERSLSDRASPMADGTDDPAILIGETYSASSAVWDHLDAEEERVEWRRYSISGPVGRARPQRIASNTPIGPVHHISTMLDTAGPGSPRRASVLPDHLPPPPGRTPPAGASFGNEIPINTPPSSGIRHPISVTPITIPIEPSSPSPISPPSPVTPPMQVVYHLQPIQIMSTPSSVQNAIPRPSNYRHHPLPAVPQVPLIHSTSGPLTNPHARMSFARIDSQPVRIRVQNTAI